MTKSYKKPKTLILTSLPGAGKGTFCQEFLKQDQFSDWKITSPGFLLKREILEQTEKGKMIQEQITTGVVLGGSIVNDIMGEELKKHPSHSLILDGFPRLDNQALWLDSFLKAQNRCVDYVLFLSVSEETILQRLATRRCCPSCPYTHKEDRLCPNCQISLETRSDDNPVAVHNRIKSFYDHTMPMIEKFYPGKIIFINANDNPEIVFQKIMSSDCFAHKN